MSKSSELCRLLRFHAEDYADGHINEQAASHIEAQEAENARLTGAIKDMAEIIERAHDSGNMVDGGDLRYWVQLLRFALSQKDKP